MPLQATRAITQGSRKPVHLVPSAVATDGVAYFRTTLLTRYADHVTRMSGVTSHHN
jgi:hypothetical protein